ncbi:FAD-dependent monooxygenase [Crenobacter sp. SG2303]|uniref:FAD-dependent monooxygenase n=1 Tax=Crenobacter oryzisoli TaxID=3056844 RepID=A0ABT7XQQ4_9NEIS|nr:FAD-dependent monooxygenase [Crenobacter sp. SG2303]MDN0076112.1 FAD-dependent monooxygenase [Crenobacter sp. SG2303]
MTARILIAGAGIAGLTAALALHAHGFTQIRLVERSENIKPLGSGINLLPQAVRELDALGLLDGLLPICVQTSELFYMNHHGDCIWREDRGKAAGFRWPQLSIHRGWLQMQLLQQVVQALGPDAVHAGKEVVDVQEAKDGQVVVCHDRTSGAEVRYKADLVIGADGIRSAVRRLLAPDEGPPPANGMVIFRGTVWGKPFLTGSSMIIAGDGIRKFVVYPMAQRAGSSEVLLNWAAAAPENPAEGYAHGDWNLPVQPSRFARDFEGWKFAGVEPAAIMLASADTFVYPMVDREPLPTWTHGAGIVLIGDAAHAMYPIGSNGATQSIIDACALAHYLSLYPRFDKALSAYEADRRVKMTELQIANRKKGPEVVIDIANAQAPGGFKDPRDVFGPGELEAIAARYARISAMERTMVNEPSPYWGSDRTARATTSKQQEALHDA